MKYIANAVGILAVIIFVLSYQQKTRRGIVLCNILSRGLYVVQYILLFAFEGAVLDIIGMLASVLAQQKNSAFIKRHLKAVMISVNLLIIAAGILLYKNIFSLLPMFGVLFHTGAFWLDNEKHIRRVSFIGSPFWLVYNLISHAYGSAIGDILTMASIGLAILRYDFKRKNDQS
ncbi:MAG: YgjV family protein [Clostridia bacterium]|nr:YgjV family protein [Clostridia bacterium]